MNFPRRFSSLNFVVFLCFRTLKVFLLVIMETITGNRGKTSKILVNFLIYFENFLMSFLFCFFFVISLSFVFFFNSKFVLRCLEVLPTTPSRTAQMKDRIAPLRPSPTTRKTFYQVFSVVNLGVRVKFTNNCENSSGFRSFVQIKWHKTMFSFLFLEKLLKICFFIQISFILVSIYVFRVFSLQKL